MTAAASGTPACYAVGPIASPATAATPADTFGNGVGESGEATAQEEAKAEADATTTDPRFHRLRDIHEWWPMASQSWSGHPNAPVFNMVSRATQCSGHDVDCHAERDGFDGQVTFARPFEHEVPTSGHGAGALGPRSCGSHIRRNYSEGTIKDSDGGYRVGDWLDNIGEPVTVAETTEANFISRTAPSDVPLLTFMLSDASESATPTPSDAYNAACDACWAAREVRDDGIAEFCASSSRALDPLGPPHNAEAAPATCSPPPPVSANEPADPQPIMPAGFQSPFHCSINAEFLPPIATAFLPTVAVDGYVDVPGPPEYTKIAERVLARGDNLNWIRAKVFTPIYDAIPTKTPPHDLRNCILTPFLAHEEQWENYFNVPAVCIASVTPTFFEDEWDPHYYSIPRLDLVAKLHDGEWIRYHPGSPLIASWQPEPACIKNRRAYTRKLLDKVNRQTRIR